MTYADALLDWKKKWEPMGVSRVSGRYDAVYYLGAYKALSEAVLYVAYEEARDTLHPSCFLDKVRGTNEGVIRIPEEWCAEERIYTFPAVLDEFEKRFPNIFSEDGWRMSVIEHGWESVVVRPDWGRKLKT
jgi:hypothetical protein